MAYGKKRMTRKRPMYRKKKGGLVKRAVRKARKTVFAKRVRTVVNRMSETKIANYSIGNYDMTAFLSNTYSTLNIKIISPSNATGGLYSIAQGTGQGAREGNRISTVSAWMTGCVHINTKFNDTNNYEMCPLYVCCYIFKLKPAITDGVASVLSIMQSTFFQAGSTTQGVQGLLNDLTRTVNSDQVVMLKKRVFKVGTQYVTSASAIGVSNIENQQYSDGTVGISQMFRINLTKLFPKTFTFNDTDNGPTNKPIYMAWVPYRVDGQYIKNSSANQNAVIPFKVDYSIDYRYKDM